MIRRIATLTVAVFVTMIGAVGCGGGQKDIVIKAPTAAEQQAQWEKLTPEQRAAAESLRQAAQATQQRLQEESGKTPNSK